MVLVEYQQSFILPFLPLNTWYPSPHTHSSTSSHLLPPHPLQHPLHPSTCVIPHLLPLLHTYYNCNWSYTYTAATTTASSILFKLPGHLLPHLTFAVTLSHPLHPHLLFNSHRHPNTFSHLYHDHNSYLYHRLPPQTLIHISCHSSNTYPISAAPSSPHAHNLTSSHSFHHSHSLPILLYLLPSLPPAPLPLSTPPHLHSC